MSERSELITKLKSSKKYRESYVRAKLYVLVSSQIRALRRRQEMTQVALAEAAEMKQSRISAMERPGGTKFNLETLVRLTAAFRVGLIVKFAPFSEMLNWENRFSQDAFDVVRIDDDIDFLTPNMATEVRIQATSALAPPQARPFGDYAPVIGAGSQFSVASIRSRIAPSRGDRPSFPRPGRDALVEGERPGRETGNQTSFPRPRRDALVEGLPLPPAERQEGGVADAIIGGNPR